MKKKQGKANQLGKDKSEWREDVHFMLYLFFPCRPVRQLYESWFALFCNLHSFLIRLKLSHRV